MKSRIFAGALLALLTTPALAQVPSFGPVPFQRSTYSATFSALAVPQTGAGDAVCLVGSASKTVYVQSVSFNAIKTTADNKIVNLVKRSAASTGGASTNATAVPLSSINSAATAVLKGYTAVPTPGAGGNIRTQATTFPAAASSTVLTYDFSAGNLGQQPVLRGTAQQLCINFPAAFTTDGPALDVSVTWTEQ